MINAIYLLLNIIMLVAGQVLFKIGLSKSGGIDLLSPWKVFAEPYILAGLFLYGLATVVWFIILSRMPLSVSYPIQSLAYVAGMIAAVLIFHEKVTLTQWLGAGLIIGGVILIAK
jgi:EamA-like transporter family.